MTRSKAPTSEGTRQRISIEGDLTVRRAGELKSTLLSPLQSAQAGQDGALEIELSQVSSFDCAGVQLLLLAKRTAHSKDIELRFVGHSPAAIEVFELLGLSAALDAPLVAAAAQESA